MALIDLRSVGPGSALSNYFMRFWLPICSTTELPPGAERPVRTQLLEERLVAFRDGQRRLGLIYGLCPHARGDMFYSAIEDDGIRCNYHGWKFDVHGNCLETPMHPPGSGVNTLAYPVAEHAGLIWGYLGGDLPPALPDVPVSVEAQSERRTRSWLETIVCELLASVESSVTVREVDGGVEVVSAGSTAASFSPPYLIIRRDSDKPTFILPASDKATTLLGGRSDATASESDAAPATREAVEDLLRHRVSEAPDHSP